MTVNSKLTTMIEYAKFGMQMCKAFMSLGNIDETLELPKGINNLSENYTTIHRKFYHVSSKYPIGFNQNTWQQGNHDIKSVRFLKALNIPPLAFILCDYLESVEFPMVETVGDHCFQQCYALTELNLPKARTISQEIIVNSGVKKLYMPVIENITYASLRGATALEEAYLESVKVVEGSALQNCPNLKILMLGKLTSLSYSFAASTELEYLGIGKGTTANITLKDQKKLTKECLLQIIENYADCTLLASKPTLTLSQESYELVFDEIINVLTAQKAVNVVVA